jgi:hypothetical protein
MKICCNSLSRFCKQLFLLLTFWSSIASTQDNVLSVIKSDMDKFSISCTTRSVKNISMVIFMHTVTYGRAEYPNCLLEPDLSFALLSTMCNGLATCSGIFPPYRPQMPQIDNCPTLQKHLSLTYECICELPNLYT